MQSRTAKCGNKESFPEPEMAGVLLVLEREDEITSKAKESRDVEEERREGVSLTEERIDWCMGMKKKEQKNHCYAQFLARQVLNGLPHGSIVVLFGTKGVSRRKKRKMFVHLLTPSVGLVCKEENPLFAKQGR